MKDNQKQQLFKTHGWDRPDSIIYRYNSHGFRTEEFDSRISFLALGCSYTEGIGLQEDQAWPNLLGKKLGTFVWNLGVGATGLDTAYRLLEYYIRYLNIKAVFLLQPSSLRLEIFDCGLPHVYLPHNTHAPLIYKKWLLDSNNYYWQTHRNLNAMKFLCNEKKIPLLIISLDDDWIGNTDKSDMARDLSHNGIKWQKSIADVFFKDFYALR